MFAKTLTQTSTRSVRTHAKQTMKSVAPVQAPVPPPPQPDYFVPAAVAAVTGLFSFMMVNKLVRPADEIPIPAQGPASDREYRMALARTRQAVHIQKAIVHARHRDLARTVVELELALAENSICRESVLTSNYSKEELLELYRIAVENLSPTVPPQYGTLLQLRQMLEISGEQADELEKNTLQKSGAFQI